MKILIFFRLLSSAHLFQSSQRFHAIEFVDRHVSEKLKHATLRSQRFLVPVSSVYARNVWCNNPPICIQNTTEKNPGGTSRKIGWGCAARFLNPYPLSDQNLRFFLPYFRPDHKFDILFQTWSPGALEPSAWPERVTSCYGTYTVGVNIKMVLWPNNEEVASFKKHTKFKTREHKPYPISDQNSRNWYPISHQNGYNLYPLAPQIHI